MENSKKEKVIKILKRVGIGISLAFNFLFALALIIGSANVNKNKTQCALAESDIQEKIEFKQDNRKFVSYNDETYTITLTADELNNYSWDNLYNLYSSNSDTFNGLIHSIDYNDFTFYGTGSDEGAELWTYNEGQHLIYFVLDSITFNDINDTNFLDSQFSYDFGSFDVTMIINGVSSTYEDLKQAIKLDIQANESNINDGIFETLTASTVGFIGTLGNGIVAMTSVFYDSANSQLTTIGLLSVIVVAVSLCYFLFRLLIGLIRMRG